MRSKKKSDGFASDPSKRCDMELKCLFSASESALIGWGLGCKMFGIQQFFGFIG